MNGGARRTRRAPGLVEPDDADPAMERRRAGAVLLSADTPRTSATCCLCGLRPGIQPVYVADMDHRKSDTRQVDGIYYPVGRRGRSR